MKLNSTLVLASLVMLVVGSAARASLIPAFTGTSPSGANTSFNYNIDFGTIGSGATAEERLQEGNFITIYDIPGFVSATAGGGFSVSVQNTGVTAAGTLPADDPALPNITFRYVGPTVAADTIFPGFSIVSTFGDTSTDNFTSEVIRNLGPTAGSIVSQIGLTTVPVPEPAAMGLLAAAGALALARRRAN